MYWENIFLLGNKSAQRCRVSFGANDDNNKISTLQNNPTAAIVAPRYEDTVPPASHDAAFTGRPFTIYIR